LALTGSTDALLFIAPALLIAIPLFCGAYVGEELVAKLAGRPARRPRRVAVLAPRSAYVASVWRPRGARLLAFSLATRPPPVLAHSLN
jgi:hypothetical protein